MPLVDSHAHLDTTGYGEELPRVLERARAAGVVHVVVIGQFADGMAAARAAIELAARDPGFLSATAGIHPHDAGSSSSADLVELRSICASAGVVAVGECGLDYHYDRSPRAEQRERFEQQVAIAAEIDKPVVVHTRKADPDTVEVLRRGLGSAGGVIHCFTGDAKAARRYLDLGLYISLSGVLTFRNADALREAAAIVPLDRLLVETDSPFLTPFPYRGKRNEPAHVRLTAQRLAELRGLPLRDIEEATTANARRALRLPIP